MPQSPLLGPNGDPWIMAPSSPNNQTTQQVYQIFKTDKVKKGHNFVKSGRCMACFDMKISFTKILLHRETCEL